MKLVLPDNSITYFDDSKFEFSDNPITDENEKNISPLFDLDKLIRHLEKPDKKFSSCFRRVNDNIRYSSVQAHYSFDFTFLEDLFKLVKIDGYGGMFSSSYKEVEILDGKLITYEGYGWGNRSWTALEGCEVLRVSCMLFGIEQPKSIKGEIVRRNLSNILKDLSMYKVNEIAFKMWNCPWQGN